MKSETEPPDCVSGRAVPAAAADNAAPCECPSQGIHVADDWTPELLQSAATSSHPSVLLSPRLASLPACRLVGSAPARHTQSNNHYLHNCLLTFIIMLTLMRPCNKIAREWILQAAATMPQLCRSHVMEYLPVHYLKTTLCCQQQCNKVLLEEQCIIISAHPGNSLVSMTMIGHQQIAKTIVSQTEDNRAGLWQSENKCLVKVQLMSDTYTAYDEWVSSFLTVC